MAFTDLWFASVKKSESSANKRWDIEGPVMETLIPFKSLLSSACFIMCDKTSAHKMKRYGESGSPCRIPRPGLIRPCGEPFIKTEKLTVEMQFMVQEIHFALKPIHFIVSSRNFHSRRSYALVMSVFRAI